MVVAVCIKSPVLGRNRRGWQQGAAGPGGLVSSGGSSGGSDSSVRDSSGGSSTRGCSEWRNWKACVNCLSSPPSASSLPLSLPPLFSGFPRTQRRAGWSADPQPRGAAGPSRRLTQPSSGTSPRRQAPLCRHRVGRGFIVAPPLVPHPPIGCRPQKLSLRVGPGDCQCLVALPCS